MKISVWMNGANFNSSKIGIFTKKIASLFLLEFHQRKVTKQTYTFQQIEAYPTSKYAKYIHNFQKDNYRRLLMGLYPFLKVFASCKKFIQPHEKAQGVIRFCEVLYYPKLSRVPPISQPVIRQKQDLFSKSDGCYALFT